MNIPVDGIVI